MRDEIVKKMHYPDAGVVYIDEDVLGIKHARPAQATLTRDELERVYGISIVIGGIAS